MKTFTALFALLVLFSHPVVATDDGDIECPSQGHPYYADYENCRAAAVYAGNREFDRCMSEPVPQPIACPQGQTPLMCKTLYCNVQAGHVQDNYESYCTTTYCWWNEPSPIVIGHLDLVGPNEGVIFDIRGNGAPIRIGWTNHGRNALLALDRDSDGAITTGRELFGNNTSQYPEQGEERNGFVALRELDTNGDGVVNAKDPRFFELLLWRDRNQDGVSQTQEISAAWLELSSVFTAYHESRKHDQHGNRMSWGGRATGIDGSTLKLTDVVFSRQ